MLELEVGMRHRPRPVDAPRQLSGLIALIAIGTLVYAVTVWVSQQLPLEPF
jgi:hypothetical protein